MSIYRNQAQRVLDHICQSSQMDPENVKKLFGITVEILDNRIEMTHIQTKLNGKQCADSLITLWDSSHPDYIQRTYNIIYQIDDLVFRMMQTPKELIILFTGNKGDYLHSYKHEGELTDDVKLAACTDCLKEYNLKTANL